MKITNGLLVRLEAKRDKDDEVEKFLSSAVPIVNAEAGTIAWFAIRFSHSEYGIFDVFPDEATREAHLNGQVAKVLMEKAGELFTVLPDIQKIDILANKLPS